MSKEHFTPISFNENQTPFLLTIEILETFGALEKKFPVYNQTKLLNILRGRTNARKNGRQENLVADTGEPVAKKAHSETAADFVRFHRFEDSEKETIRAQINIINEFFEKQPPEAFSTTKDNFSAHYTTIRKQKGGQGQEKGLKLTPTPGETNRIVTLKKILSDIIETLMSYCTQPTLVTSTSQSSPASFLVPDIQSSSTSESEFVAEENYIADSPSSIESDEEIMEETKPHIYFHPQPPSPDDLVSLSPDSLHKFNPYIPMQSSLSCLEEFKLSDPIAYQYFLDEGRFADPSTYMVYGELPPDTAPSAPPPSSELSAAKLADNQSLLPPPALTF